MTKDTFHLRGVHIQPGFGPDQVIGSSHFLVHRPLRLEALLDLLGSPATSPEALLLSRG